MDVHRTGMLAIAAGSYVHVPSGRTLLLVLPLAGVASVVHDWLPSTLVDAPVELLATAHLGDYLPAMAVSAVATLIVLTAAVGRLRRREA